MSETTRGTLAIPEGEHRLPPTAPEELDRAVAELGERADAWAALGLDGRLALLDECITDTLEVAPRWVDASVAAKGIDPDSPVAGEEWVNGPGAVLRNLRLLQRTLTDLRDHGAPRFPGRPHVRPNGQVAVPVLPTDAVDATLLFPGFTAEVWMDPELTLDELPDTVARNYRAGHRASGGVALVLGAGNVSSIGPMDVLWKLFGEDQVVVCKANPVNEYVGPHWAEAFRALVREGFLRIVYGGAAEGAHLTNHPGVDAVHITGSDKTHDAIVFGTGAEGRERKQRGEPLLDKPISSELGNVTPVIVVPGPWSAGDVAFHGDNIATMLVNNAGFNCIAARVIVTHRGWAKRRPLLDAVRSSLRRATPRVPYYPGARERWERFVEGRESAEWFGDDGPGCVPWTLLSDLDADAGDDIAFTTEAFNGVFAEAAIDAPQSVPAYLERAVAFCNDTLWGTLSATLIVHPASLKDPAIESAVERALQDLRYGSVVVNHWSAIAYGIVTGTWGAFPGHEPTDIQSGRGVVHNSFLFDRPQKTVVRGPFRPPLEPWWFHTHREVHHMGRATIPLEARRDLSVVPRLLAHGVRNEVKRRLGR